MPLPPFVQMSRDHTSQVSSPSLLIAQAFNDPTLTASSPFYLFAASQNKQTNKQMYVLMSNVYWLHTFSKVKISSEHVLLV